MNNNKYNLGSIKNIETIEIKEGISLTLVDTKKKFNVNRVSINFIKKEEENFYESKILGEILESVNSKYPTKKLVCEKLDNLYGARVGVEYKKSSRNDEIESFVETIRNDFALEGEDILKESLDYLFIQTFEPLIENGTLSQKHFEIAKTNRIEIMESLKDDKSKYAEQRFEEEFYKDELFAKCKGKAYINKMKDVEKLTSEKIYDLYKKYINDSKIIIHIYGDISEKREEILSYIVNNDHIKALNLRKPKFNEFDFDDIDKINDKRKLEEVKVIKENEETLQSNLILGYWISGFNRKDLSVSIIFKRMFGYDFNSRLFKTVREKESLAYSIWAYISEKLGTMKVVTGIEKFNYDKTVNTIDSVLKSMQNGEITDEEVKIVKNNQLTRMKELDEDFYGIRDIVDYKENINPNYSLESFIEDVSKVTKNDVINFAKRIKLQLIYFLTSKD